MSKESVKLGGKGRKGRRVQGGGRRVPEGEGTKLGEEQYGGGGGRGTGEEAEENKPERS